MPLIDPKEIFDKTNSGRTVIEMLYPDSHKSFNNPKRNFINNFRNGNKADKDRTGSCALRMYDGLWKVKDYGDSPAKFRNAIELVMHENRLDFYPAMQWILDNCNIVTEEKQKLLIRADYDKRDATAEEEDGKWYFEVKPAFTVEEVRTILAPEVWQWLIYQTKDTESKDAVQIVMERVLAVFAKYHFYSLKSYTMIKGRVAQTFSSNEHFPIFMFDEGKFKKVYKPKDQSKFRFMYYGHSEMPTDFLFGYAIAKKAHSEIVSLEDDENMDAEEGAETETKKPKKLNHTFIVSGGSDALNIAVIGQCFKNEKDNKQLAEMFFPVWMNSETAKLSSGQYKNLQAISETVYNLPDIDATGKREAHKVATEYLDIKTIYLPEELKLKNDSFRRKPMKDVRDYFRYYKPFDFFTLIKTAYPYRFWDFERKNNKKGEFIKWGYSVNNKHLYNFLARNGFYRFETESEKDGYFYIHIQGNIVRKIEPKRIRDFINEFIERRNPDVELMNTFLRTNQLNEASLSNLPFITIDFTDFDKETQWIFYNNLTCEVKADGITEYKPGEVEKFVWEEEVINHKAKKLPDFFTISPSTNIESRLPDFDIEIHDKNCLVFRYLINTSRIFWREELETRLEGIVSGKDREEYSAHHKFTAQEEILMDGKPAETEREAYRTANRWNIAGDLLTEREKKEQKLQLINKIFSIGYVFHRHKENGKAWAIWGMDAKLSEGSESHGGSGKSLLPNIIHSQKLMKTQYREGRNPKLIDNPHFYEGTDRHTDMMLVDDCHRYLKFDFFFSAISGPITVNPKNNKQYTIGFVESPKFWFTSNFPPYDADISTERRILYMLYSDYYHYSRMGEYREDRSILDEFGKNFGSEFTEGEWNYFLNFIMQCIKFYLSCSVKINPPMDNVNARNLKSTMGDAFEPWADVYFSTESNRLNQLVIKDEALNDYVKSTNQKNLSTQRFTKSLKAWSYYNGYELNPKEVQNTQGRVIKRVEVQDGNGGTKEVTKEMIFIKTQPVVPAALINYNEKVGKDLMNDGKVGI